MARKVAAPPQSRKFQILLYPKQAAFISSQARRRAFCGGRGSGKSYSGAYDLLMRASAKKDRLYMVVAPVFSVLRDATCRSFLGIGRKMGLIPQGPAGFNKTEWRARLTSGSEVVFKSAEDPEKLRGPNISGLWIDEAQGVPKLAYDLACACLREDPIHNWATCTFTPKGKLHWTYDEFARPDADGNLPPNTEIWQATTGENPFLPAEFEADLKRQYTSMTAQQELGGKFLDLPGTMFQRQWFAKQIVGIAPKEARRVRYWDKACLLGSTLSLTLRGEIPIRDIVPGDYVLTRCGWRRVINAWETKTVQELVSVIFSDGSIVTGTADHPVWTENRGWVELASLESTDRAMKVAETASCQKDERDCRIRQSSSSMESHIAGGQGSDTSRRCDGTRNARSITRKHCIRPSGNSTTAIFPLAMNCITLTGTSTTTRLKILPASRTATTCAGQNAVGSVLSAAKHFPERPNGLLAQIHAERNSRGVPVWDLEVEDAHEFFANGVLVHNSTKGGGCFTAGSLIAGTWENVFFIESIVRGQWSTFTRDEIINLTAQMDQERYGYGGVRIFIEEEPGPIWEEELVQMGDGRRLPLRNVVVGDNVIGMDGLPHAVNAVHVQGRLPCLRISTDTGRVIHAAANHPFLTPEGWVNAGDLQIGNVLALRCGIATQPTSVPTTEECRLAGYFVGDGCCTMGKTSINAVIEASDSEMGKDIIHCANSIGANVHVGGSRGWSYYLSGGGRPWLRRVGLAGKGTADKNTPEWILTANNERIANFIGAFFACDGCVSIAKHGTIVELYNTNLRLLHEIQSLCLRFGIYARLRIREYTPEMQKNRKRMYRLLFRRGDDSIGRFAKSIPVYGKKGPLLAGHQRMSFDQPYLPDPIVSITPVASLLCRCLEVQDASSFLVNDIVVHNSGGKDSVRNSIRQLAGQIVAPDKVSGHKRVRAEGFAAQCEAGNMFLVKDDQLPWISDFIEEACQFPDGDYSDQVDACSGAFNMLTKGVYSHPATDGNASGGGNNSSAAAGLQAAMQRDQATGRPVSGLIGGVSGGFAGGDDMRTFRPR